MYHLRISHAFWVVMAPLVFAAAPAARGQDPAEARPGKNRALLVACQNYPKGELTSLRFARADVLAFKDALLHTGFFEGDITLLCDPEEPKQTEKSLPKAANILAQLNTLQNVGEDGILIVALSGHGIQLEADKEKRNYFCPIDAKVEQRSNLIDLTDLYEMLKKCRSQRKLLLVDACRNDPFPEGQRGGRQKFDFAQFRKQDVPQGIAALFSCSPGEKSWEDRDLGHGIFFYHLLEAWNGAAYDSNEKLTLGGLFDYVINHTSATALRLRGSDQTPQWRTEGSGAWDLWKGRVGEVGLLKGHKRGVGSVAFCPEGKALSGSYDDTMRLWDLRSGKQLDCFKGPQTDETTMVHSVAVSPKGRYALSGSSDRGRELRLRDLKEGTEQDLRGHSDAVHAVVFSPYDDGRYALSGGLDGTVRFWDLQDATTEKLCFLAYKKDQDEKEVYSVALSPDRRYALSGGEDTTVWLWDLKTGKEIRRFTGHEKAIRSVAFSPNSQRAISGSEDGTIRLWDVEKGIELRRFLGHTDKVLAVAFSPDLEGRRILSGSADGRIRLWDMESGKEHIFEGHRQQVLSVAFSPDGRRALSGGADRTVRLWNLPLPRK